MIEVLLILILQSLLGGFDTIYYHEYQQRLALKPSAAKELLLHGIRSIIYSIIFILLAWFELRGSFVLILILFFSIEIIITLWDFVEEDRSRKLPAPERIMHSIMGIIYGIFLTLIAPILNSWWQTKTEIIFVQYGHISILLSLMSFGTLTSGLRDLMSSLTKKEFPKIWTRLL